MGSGRCSFGRLPNIPGFWYFLVYRAPRNFTPVNLECAFGTKIRPIKCMCDENWWKQKYKKKEVLAITIFFWKKVFAIKNIRPNNSCHKYFGLTNRNTSTHLLHHVYHWWTLLNKKVLTKSSSVERDVPTCFWSLPFCLDI